MCFKEHFEDVRRNIQKFFKEGQEVKQWEFANELVFTRIDLFIQRLKIVEVSISEYRLKVAVVAVATVLVMVLV